MQPRLTESSMMSAAMNPLLREPRLLSSALPLCSITLPYKGRQLYMAPIDIYKPEMPDGYEDYLDIFKTVTEMACAFDGEAFLTVDEKHLAPGDTQRRPGPHIDGNYNAAMGLDWGGGGGGWNHSCNIIPDRMAVIVASSQPLCKFWEGTFSGVPKSDGDCSHIITPKDDEFAKIVPKDEAYLLSKDCIHESLPAPETMSRSFMRIALPVKYRTYL